MFIRSERLFLRPAWPEETGELATLLSGEAGVMSNIAAIDRSRHERATIVDLAITLPSDSGAVLIGGIDLTRADDDELRLGYWLSRPYWGHGYAAEAARGVLAISAMLGHARVFANQSVDDRASLLVLTRAGFRPTGERRSEGGREAAVYIAEIGAPADDGDDGADEVRAA